MDVFAPLRLCAHTRTASRVGTTHAAPYPIAEDKRYAGTWSRNVEKSYMYNMVRAFDLWRFQCWGRSVDGCSHARRSQFKRQLIPIPCADTCTSAMILCRHVAPAPHP